MAVMLLAVRREAWSATLLAVDWEPHVSTLPSDPVDRGPVFIPTRPLILFMRVEARSSVLLLSATVIALAWANSPWLASYEVVWTTNLSVQVGEAELAKDLRHWVNDGLMTLYFLVMGLELTRELKLYERRHWSAAIVPATAALGGMVAPGLVYLAFNAAGPAARGWAIVTATDLALALGVLALVGPRCPPQLRAVVLMVALVDGLAVVALVAVLYPELVNLIALAVVLELFAVTAVLRLLRVLRTLAYLVVGVALWVAMSVSGLHPAIAGVVLGVVLTTFPPLPIGAALDAGLARLLERDQSPVTISGAVGGAAPPNERLQELLHPWSSYLIVPLFALANAGVTLDRDLLARAVGSPITLGVIMGLVAGKLLGLLGATQLAARSRLGTLPRLVTYRQLAGAAATSGIGFTLALFLTDLTLVDRLAQDEAKIGILVASATAATLGWLLFTVTGSPDRGQRPPAGGKGTGSGATPTGERGPD
jgi:Na+:H+ antiporter, NhaA family